MLGGRDTRLQYNGNEGYRHEIWREGTDRSTSDIRGTSAALRGGEKMTTKLISKALQPEHIEDVLLKSRMKELMSGCVRGPTATIGLLPHQKEGYELYSTWKMKNFIADDNAILGINFGGNPATTEGEIKKVEKRGIVEGIIDWAGRHPYLSAAGLITLFAGGIAANEYQNNKKFAGAVDSGISKAKAEISAGASGFLGFVGKIGNQPPVIESISVNNTDNLTYVNQSEIDKFYQEFDFSQFKK